MKALILCLIVGLIGCKIDSDKQATPTATAPLPVIEQEPTPTPSPTPAPICTEYTINFDSYSLAYLFGGEGHAIFILENSLLPRIWNRVGDKQPTSGQFLLSGNPTEGFYNGNALLVTFDVPVNNVNFDVIDAESAGFRLEAYDAGDNLLDIENGTALGDGVAQHITSDADGISALVITNNDDIGSDGFYIDTFKYTICE